MTRAIRADHDAVAITSTWVGDRRVRAVVEAVRRTLDLGHLGAVLVDQMAVLTVAERLADVAPVDSDGAVGCNPFDLVTGWWSDPTARRGAQADAHRLGTVTAAALGALAHVGVPVDPGAVSDQVVMTSLLLLDVDWSASPREIAEALQPPAHYGVTRDGRGVEFRRDSRADVHRAGLAFLDEVGERLRQAEGRDRLPGRPYAGGSARTPGRQQIDAERRRDALREVLARWPDLEVADLLAGSGRRLDHRAAALNAALVARGLAPYGRSDLRHRARTLRRDLAALREDQSRSSDVGGIR